MNEISHFSIVFKKLNDGRDSLESSLALSVKSEELTFHEVTADELDEISRIRRMILEVTEPEPMSYTTT